MNNIKNIELPSQGAIAFHLLKFLYDRNTLTTEKAYQLLGDQFELSEEVKNVKYEKEGKESYGNMWKDRVRAAKNNCLSLTGLVIQHNNKNGIWEITQEGRIKFEELRSLGKDII